MFYENIFNLDNLVKLDRIFKAYDEIHEIFPVFITCLEEKKVALKEVNCDGLTLEIKLMSLTGKEKIINLKLYKKEIGQDSLIKELCDKINILEEENKNLKEEMKIIKNELKEVKNWQNNKEEEFKKLLEIKKAEIKQKKFDSKIITKSEDLAFIENIYKNNDEILMNKEFKTNLLYRATRDGDSSKDFHSKCDNIRDTLSLVKTKNGLIFGGYTNESWNGENYKKDDRAFCFSIDLKKKYNSKKTSQSIYCHKDYGPCFGNALFWVYSNCLSMGGFMNDGLNQRYDNQLKENEINNGKRKFSVMEVEVFEIILD